jgi:plasmid stabilization system protein ParE
MKVIVSDEADNDLMQIFSYLDQQSPQAVQSILNSINRRFVSLESFPLSGAPVRILVKMSEALSCHLT